MTASFDLPRRPRILVITLRRLGDVLLTTPLVRMLRNGFPDATIDMFVFAGTESILKGNPDIDSVVTLPQRPTVAETIAVIRRLWRRYDLAISTQSGDRPTFFALAAGRRRVGLVPRRGDAGGWWKPPLFHRPVPADYAAHRVLELAKLATAVGLTGTADIVCPQGASAEGLIPQKPYAVLHVNPMYPYRRWGDASWRELARGLAARGLHVVATEADNPAERAYTDRLWESAETPVDRVRLNWPGLASLLKGAAVYVGPDTSVTHLAAGTGCPTVALYGPASPSVIGPWPVGGLAEAWAPKAAIQHRGNVWVVQNPLPCLPCEKLGCEGHRESYSRCLDELVPAHVFRAVDEALGSHQAPNAVVEEGKVATQ